MGYAYFTGPAGTAFCGLTNALILRVSLPFTVWAVTVMVLVTWFCPEPLNLTNNSPLSPGAIGVFLGYWGTVQPQLLVALVMIRGASPVLVNLNTVSWGAFCAMLPKSCSVFSNDMTGTFPCASSRLLAVSTLSATILSEAFSLQDITTNAMAMIRPKCKIVLFMIKISFYKNNH